MLNNLSYSSNHSGYSLLRFLWITMNVFLGLSHMQASSFNNEEKLKNRDPTVYHIDSLPEQISAGSLHLAEDSFDLKITKKGNIVFSYTMERDNYWEDYLRYKEHKFHVHVNFLDKDGKPLYRLDLPTKVMKKGVYSKKFWGYSFISSQDKDDKSNNVCSPQNIKSANLNIVLEKSDTIYRWSNICCLCCTCTCCCYLGMSVIESVIESLSSSGSEVEV